MSMEQIAQLLRNSRRLNIFAWIVLVVVPAFFLLGLQQLLRWKEDLSHPGSEMVLYILLVLAIIVPACGLLIARIEKKRYRRGTSDAKTPWHLFLGFSVFQMFLIYIIYVLATIATISGSDSSYLIFYAIAIIWSLICWPRKRACEKLQEEMKSAGVNQ